jgi:hypothetical protein
MQKQVNKYYITTFYKYSKSISVSNYTRNLIELLNLFLFDESKTISVHELVVHTYEYGDPYTYSRTLSLEEAFSKLEEEIASIKKDYGLIKEEPVEQVKTPEQVQI